LNALRAYKYKMPSSIKNIGNTVKDVLSFLQSAYGEIDKCTLFELRVILNELILNAVKHGNLEDETKYVSIKAFLSNGDKALIVIGDDGLGYDYRSVLFNSINNNICNLSDIKETGRGILIVKSLCEKIKVNKKGNMVCVVKKLSCNHDL